LARWISFATRRFTSQAAEEHLGEQIPVPPGKELRELTLAFNTMSSTLRRSHDHLEERIEERTTDLRASNKRLEREITERVQAEGACGNVGYGSQAEAHRETWWKSH
jgi:EAL domain-containing protein (putative c-di-GMP-specific phosphodiesterase class I)